MYNKVKSQDKLFLFPFHKWCTLFNYLRVKLLRKIWKYNLNTKRSQITMFWMTKFYNFYSVSMWWVKRSLWAFLLVTLAGMYSSLFLTNDPKWEICQHVFCSSSSWPWNTRVTWTYFVRSTPTDSQHQCSVCFVPFN